MIRTQSVEHPRASESPAKGVRASASLGEWSRPSLVTGLLDSDISVPIPSGGRACASYRLDPPWSLHDGLRTRCAFRSSTRSEGIPKESVAELACHDMNAKSRLRHWVIGAGPSESKRRDRDRLSECSKKP